MHSPIAPHFRQVSHNVSGLQYIGIEKIKKEVVIMRRNCYKGNVLGFILNEDFNMKPFL